uniref:Uncharacterized protein n=1 Tax=Magallana gigas TaxID=29159 RepID=A0A8W8K171_MAGGI
MATVTKAPRIQSHKLTEVKTRCVSYIPSLEYCIRRSTSSVFYQKKPCRLYINMIGFTIFVMVVFETYKWWKKDVEVDIDNEISREIDEMLENIQNSL